MDDRLMYRREFFIGGAWAAPTVAATTVRDADAVFVVVRGCLRRGRPRRGGGGACQYEESLNLRTPFPPGRFGRRHDRTSHRRLGRDVDGPDDPPVHRRAGGRRDPRPLPPGRDMGAVRRERTGMAVRRPPVTGAARRRRAGGGAGPPGDPARLPEYAS